MRSGWPLRIARVALGVSLVLGAAMATAARVDAASGLQVVGAADYAVDLAGHQVVVRIALRVTNTTSETVAHRYWLDRFTLLVPPQAEDVAASAPGWSPSVRVLRRSPAALLLEIALGGRLWSGRSASVTLTFHLPDRGGPPLRPVRVGAGVIAFPVWAFASDGASGASVTVTIPAGYQVTAPPGAFPRQSLGLDGSTHLASGPLVRPTRFSALVVAEGEGIYVERSQTVTVAGQPVTLRLRWWADDPDWGQAEGAVVAQALAALGRVTGRPYLGPQPLVVSERAATALAGLAAQVDPQAGRLDLAWSADPLSVAAAVARLVVNGSLVAEGWAVDGLADLLALQLAATMGIPLPAASAPVTGPEMADVLSRPLNGVPAAVWLAALPGLGGAAGLPKGPSPGAGTVGGVLPSESAEAPLIRRAALAVAREILARLPVDGHGTGWAVLLDALRGTDGALPGASGALPGASRAPGGTAGPGASATPGGTAGPGLPSEEETAWGGPDPAAVAAARAGGSPVDWRGLLDRLEAAAGRSFADLWGARIVTPAEWPFLRRRAAAHARFNRLVTGDPPPNAAVAVALAAWQFDEANALMAQVEDQQARRRRLLALAAGLALRLPPHGDADALRQNLDAELAAVEAVAAAVAARPSAMDPLTALGTLGLDPDGHLAAARAALAAGQFSAAEAAAMAARRAWEGALELGRSRMTALGIALGIVGVGIGWLGSGRDRPAPGGPTGGSLRRWMGGRWARWRRGRLGPPGGRRWLGVRYTARQLRLPGRRR
jgi:hypothetical protein